MIVRKKSMIFEIVWLKWETHGASTTQTDFQLLTDVLHQGFTHGQYLIEWGCWTFAWNSRRINCTQGFTVTVSACTLWRKIIRLSTVYIH